MNKLQILVFILSTASILSLQQLQSEQIQTKIVGLFNTSQSNSIIQDDNYSYIIFILKNKIIIETNAQNIKSLIIPRTKTYNFQINSHIETNMNNIQITQNNQQVKFYIQKTSKIVTQWIYQIYLTKDIIIHGKYSINNHFIISLIGLAYVILLVLSLPPLRKYLSDMSQKVKLLSIIMLLKTIQTIIYILIIHLFYRIISLNLAFDNVLLIFVQLVSIIIIICYQIGLTYCCYQIIERNNWGNNKKIFSWGFGFIVIILPLLLTYFPKGIFYYFYLFLPIIIQFCWSIYAKVQFTIRFSLACLSTIWCLILLNMFYPTLHYEQTSLKATIFLGYISISILVLTTIFYIFLYFYLKQSHRSIQIIGLTDKSQEKVYPDAPQLVSQQSTDNIIQKPGFI